MRIYSDRQSPSCSTMVAIESTNTATVVYCQPTGGIGTTTHTLGSSALSSATGTTLAALPIPTGTSSSTDTSSSTSTPAPAPAISTTQGRLTSGAIAGIAIGSFLAVAIVVVLSIFLWKAHKRDRERPVVVQAPPVVYEPKVDAPHHMHYGASSQPPEQYPIHEMEVQPVSATQNSLWRPGLPEMDAHTVQQQHGGGGRPA
jgi:hypothetical protein